jgi:hypothetical protein
MQNSRKAARGLRALRRATGQPEVRDYRTRRRDNDQPFGDWSDLVEVTARP